MCRTPLTEPMNKYVNALMLMIGIESLAFAMCVDVKGLLKVGLALLGGFLIGWAHSALWNR